MGTLGFFDIVVREDERAFLWRDGKFLRLLEPGRHRQFDPAGRLKAEVTRIVHGEVPAERALLFEKTHPKIASEHFTIVQPGPHEVAIVSMDGAPEHLVLPHKTRAFWKTLTLVEVETIDTAVNLRIDKAQLAKLDLERSQVVVHDVVASHEAGLLFVDGDFVEQLGPGRHAFWAIDRKVRIIKVDLRPTPLEVTAQEILTKDRVGIRVTLTAFYKILDALKATTGTGDVTGSGKLTQAAHRI
jgi:hypothetical protein